MKIQNLYILLTFTIGIFFVGCANSEKPIKSQYLPAKKINLKFKPLKMEQAKEAFLQSWIDYIKSNSAREYGWHYKGNIYTKYTTPSFIHSYRLATKFMNEGTNKKNTLVNVNNYKVFVHSSNYENTFGVRRYNVVSLRVHKNTILETYYVPKQAQQPSIGKYGQNKYVLVLRNASALIARGMPKQTFISKYGLVKFQTFSPENVVILGEPKNKHSKYHDVMFYVGNINPYNYDYKNNKHKEKLTKIIALPFDTKKEMENFANVILGLFPSIKIK